MDNGFDIPDTLRCYCAETEYRGEFCGCKCKKRTYGIGSRTSDSDNLCNMAIRASGGMGSADREAAKRPRLISCISPAEVGGVDYSVIKLMAKFYMLFQCVRERNRLDLNTACTDHDQSQSDHRDEGVQVLYATRSPWELGEVWGYNSLSIHAFTASVEVFADSRNNSSCTM